MLVTIAKNAIANNRIAQSYLIHGKWNNKVIDMIIETVKLINCEDKNIKPCNKCFNCKSITEKKYTEMVFVSDEIESISIEMTREIQKFTKYSPLNGKYKVVIVPFIERMTKESANAFLKTLEEPLKNIVFILHTEEEKKNFPTILSRCQKVFMGHMTECEYDKKNMEVLNNIDEISFIERMKMTKNISNIENNKLLYLFFRNIEEKINKIESLENIPDIVNKGKILLRMKKYLTPRINQNLWLENLLILWES